MKSLRATKINPACGQRPWGEVLFRRRPRSRRSSNEVAPSAGGGGGARDLRSRFSSSSPVRRGVASADIVRSLPSLVGQSKLRFVESPSYAVPLGTPTGVLHSLKGVGARPNILRGLAEKVGGWPRGLRPLGCVLCLLSVASQKVGAPAAQAGERKEIDSPREGWVPTGDREASSRGSAAPSPCSWRQRN